MQDRVEVEAMLRAGKRFGQIEDRINAMHVNEEAKSALWLLAWSEQRTDTRRPILEEDPSEALPAGRRGRWFKSSRPDLAGRAG
jgi:hypothetical protein